MSDSADSPAIDITKLKVADLRKELRARGFSAVGTKSELIDRLQGALLTGDASDESALVDSVLIDEEDDVLNDVELDDEHDKSLDLYSTTHEEDALITPPISISSQPILKRAHHEIITATSESKENAPKKIVLDRNSTSVPISVPETKTSEENLSNNGKDQGEEKKIVKLGSLSEKERLEMRARKFGIPLTSDLKKEVRAQRFGLNNTKSISNNKVDTSLDVLKKRAERFGSSVSKKLSEAEAKEKLEKRKERFCTVQNTNAATSTPKLKIQTGMTNDEKAKLRLERFKMEVK